MPVYNCISPAGAVPMDVRPKIAKAFTDIHCDSTNAPRSFVHVFFKETPEGADSGYGTPHYIDAGNRAGRPAEVVLKLKNDLRQAYAENAGVALDQVGARIVEGPTLVDGGRSHPARTGSGRRRVVRPRGRLTALQV